MWKIIFMLELGLIKDADTTYDGVVTMIWGRSWDIPEDEYLLNEGTSERVLHYNAVIVGGSQVFKYEEWDILYHITICQGALV